MAALWREHPWLHRLAPKEVMQRCTTDRAGILSEALGWVIAGTYDFSKVHAFGLATEAITLAHHRGLRPEDVAAQIGQLRQQEISGEAPVPVVGGRTQ
jgi:basic membrane lipoprotein Med (substrate-binding protein (PBP1-ABC) superfamily)